MSRTIKPGSLLAVVLIILAALSRISEARDIESLLRTLTLEEKLGQMLLPAFRTQDGRGVTSVTAEVAQAVRQYNVGGVILFSENLVSKDQTVKLIADLQSASPTLPLFVGVDQEGGRVSRFSYGIIMPGNMALAATGKTENAFLAAKAIGEELAELGFNLNFAPVLDVNSNPDNPVIGVRSFGEDPETAAKMGRAYIRGLHAAGIAAVIKHFPGHGDTVVDSHLGLPSLPYTLEQLEARELKPFRYALNQPVDMIMTAHIALPKLEYKTAVSKKDGTPIHLPATLSQTVLTDVLRKRLGYDGVIITDALNMKAIADHFGTGEAAVSAIDAGADILLMPELEQSFNALLAAVNSGKIPEQRIDQSVRRILAVKDRLGLFTQKQRVDNTVSHEERNSLGASLAGQAVTLLKNRDSAVPFELRPKLRILLLAPAPELLSLMRQETLKILRSAGLQDAQVQYLEYQGKLSDSHRAAIENSDQIILATASADAAGRDPGRSPIAATAAQIVKLAANANKPVAVIAARNPYDIVYLEEASAYVAVYAPIAPNIAAGIRVLFGQARPLGKLPVSIPGQGGRILYPKGFGLQ